MASINLTSPIFYKNGQGGVSAVVGYESLSNRVVRYTLHTGESGAGRISLAFSGNWEGNGTLPKLRFYIGTDPLSHANAGQGAAYTGELSRSGYTYTGAAEVMLLPDRDYYVWVFPATEVFGWVQWSYRDGAAVAECSGGALTALSAEPGTLGSPMTLVLTRYADFTHTVTCTLGSRTLTVAEDSTETQISWTPPLGLAEEIPDSLTGQAVFTVTSLGDGQGVGTVQTAVAITVPDSVKPTVKAQWLDLSGAYDRFGTCVQLVSRLGVEVEGQGAYGSTIVSSALTLNGKPYNGGVLMDAGEQELRVTVTDSRGSTGTWTQILSVAEYAVPWVRIDASRCDEDGTSNDMGEFARLTFTGESCQVADKNTAALTFGYGDSTETLAVAVGALSHSCIIPADSTGTLSLWAVLRDELTASPAASMVLSIGYATVDFFAGGKGIAFGTTATKEGFACAMPTDFRGFPVAGLPQPLTEDAAVPKRYVDAAGEQLKKYVDSKTQAAPDASPLPVSANVPVQVTMAQGEAAHISYITSSTANGDIFLLANGRKPDSAGYSYAGYDSNFTDGQIGFSGSGFAAVVDAEVRFHGADLIVIGRDLRGNNTGVGRSFLVWRDLGALDSLTFSAAGTMVPVGMVLKAVQLPAVGKLSAQIVDGVLQISGGISAAVEGGVLVVDGNMEASVVDNVLVIKETSL